MRLSRRGGQRDAATSPRIAQKLEARAALAAAPAGDAGADRAALRRQAAGDDVVPIMLERYAPLWLAGCSAPGSWPR